LTVAELEAVHCGESEVLPADATHVIHVAAVPGTPAATSYCLSALLSGELQ
jgi:hypothetical protein